MKKNINTLIKKNLSEKLVLPKDIVLGASILTITGQSEIFIENYKGIIEYNTDTIKIQTKNCRIEINGKGLLISYYTNDEMKINGIIYEIKYNS